MHLRPIRQAQAATFDLSRMLTTKSFTAAALTLLLTGTSSLPSHALHRHHRSNYYCRQTRREDATKHKLHGQHQNAIEGFLVLDENGEVVQSSNANVLFNPASTLKLATSYMALSKYGPETTFQTEVYVDGDIDENGEVLGNMYVTGADPLMITARAEQMARELNAQGIRSVKGNLYVTPEFRLNISQGGLDAGKHLRSIWEGHPRKYHHHLVSSGAHLRIFGRVETGDLPGVTTRVTSMQSPRLCDILKVMLCYSHNGMAEELGAMMGGPKAVNDFVVEQLGLDKDEVKFSSASGLGVNRISPAAMSKILFALKDELADHNLSLTSILPVAGVDPGTLERRFTQAIERGTVVAKTGTLTDTDRGVSALAGLMKTQTNGELLFVIFEQHGSVNKFRRRQEDLVAEVQRQCGGAAKFEYDQKPLVCHLGH
jgi:D-alanyl-D-alanine carboxypeptidase/D-alanyl-D-alanine-endopeptidase (penicillin-binding protein 4)